ncbi:hypothetical protein CYMTET_42326 [Cymbomonas tetramitiformis]|uniref:Uncharacterized protein n=1 Tax=Cymbomonas tetramitiformis TaxID=36881 RepID=A0AAE0C6G6_9CHLO|nr:hypothetical protein CYMTET_42326 [Cymbomonas tetramitiformis]
MVSDANDELDNVAGAECTEELSAAARGTLLWRCGDLVVEGALLNAVAEQKHTYRGLAGDFSAPQLGPSGPFPSQSNYQDLRVPHTWEPQYRCKHQAVAFQSTETSHNSDYENSDSQRLRECGHLTVDTLLFEVVSMGNCTVELSTSWGAPKLWRCGSYMLDASAALSILRCGDIESLPSISRFPADAASSAGAHHTYTCGEVILSCDVYNAVIAASCQPELQSLPGLRAQPLLWRCSKFLVADLVVRAVMNGECINRRLSCVPMQGGSRVNHNDDEDECMVIKPRLAQHMLAPPEIPLVSSSAECAPSQTRPSANADVLTSELAFYRCNTSTLSAELYAAIITSHNCSAEVHATLPRHRLWRCGDYVVSEFLLLIVRIMATACAIFDQSYTETMKPLEELSAPAMSKMPGMMSFMSSTAGNNASSVAVMNKCRTSPTAALYVDAAVLAGVQSGGCVEEMDDAEGWTLLRCGDDMVDGAVVRSILNGACAPTAGGAPFGLLPCPGRLGIFGNGTVVKCSGSPAAAVSADQLYRCGRTVVDAAVYCAAAEGLCIAEEMAFGDMALWQCADMVIDEAAMRAIGECTCASWHPGGHNWGEPHTHQGQRLYDEQSGGCVEEMDDAEGWTLWRCGDDMVDGACSGSPAAAVSADQLYRCGRTVVDAAVYCAAAEGLCIAEEMAFGDMALWQCADMVIDEAAMRAIGECTCASWHPGGHNWGEPHTHQGQRLYDEQSGGCVEEMDDEEGWTLWRADQLYRCGRTVVDAAVYCAAAEGLCIAEEMAFGDMALWQCADMVIDEAAMRAIGECTCASWHPGGHNWGEPHTHQGQRLYDEQGSAGMVTSELAHGANVHGNADADISHRSLYLDAAVLAGVQSGGCVEEMDDAEGWTLWRCGDDMVDGACSGSPAAAVSADQLYRCGRTVVDAAVYCAAAEGLCIAEEMAFGDMALWQCADMVIDEAAMRAIGECTCASWHPGGHNWGEPHTHQGQRLYDEQSGGCVEEMDDEEGWTLWRCGDDMVDGACGDAMLDDALMNIITSGACSGYPPGCPSVNEGPMSQLLPLSPVVREQCATSPYDNENFDDKLAPATYRCGNAILDMVVYNSVMAGGCLVELPLDSHTVWRCGEVMVDEIVMNRVLRDMCVSRSPRCASSVTRIPVLPAAPWQMPSLPLAPNDHCGGMGDIEAQDTLITSSAVLYRCGPAVILDASVYASIAAGNGCRIEMQSADRTLWRCTDEVVDEEAMNLVRSGACMLDQSSRCVPNQNEVVSMLPPPPADNTNQCADNISLGASDLNASAIAMYQCGPLVVDADVYHSITVGGCNIELSSQGRTLWRCANGAVLDEEVMYGVMHGTCVWHGSICRSPSPIVAPPLSVPTGDKLSNCSEAGRSGDATATLLYLCAGKLVVDHAVYTSVMAGGCILELASRSRLLRRCADGAVVDEQLATLITSGKCIQQHPAICSPAIFPPVPLTTPPEPPLNGGFPEWCPETYDSDEAASALLMYRCGRVVVSAEVYNLVMAGSCRAIELASPRGILWRCVGGETLLDGALIAAITGHDCALIVNPCLHSPPSPHPPTLALPPPGPPPTPPPLPPNIPPPTPPSPLVVRVAFTLSELRAAIQEGSIGAGTLSLLIYLQDHLVLDGRALPAVVTGAQIAIMGQCAREDGALGQCQLDAQNASRVFVIHPGGTLTLSALALLRGHAGDGEKDYGGIIKNQGGALLLEDSMLSGGQAWSGGAIYTCCGATTHLRACEVRSNRALATRYIDHVAGGGAFLNDDSELALVNCTILDNCPKAEQGAASQGGVVFSIGMNATVEFEGGVVAWNRAAYGGVAKNDWASTVRFSGEVLLHNNSALVAGGVVYSGRALTIFHGAVLAENRLHPSSAAAGAVVAAVGAPPHSAHSLVVTAAVVNGDAWVSAELCNLQCTTHLSAGASAVFLDLPPPPPLPPGVPSPPPCPPVDPANDQQPPPSPLTRPPGAPPPPPPSACFLSGLHPVITLSAESAGFPLGATRYHGAGELTVAEYVRPFAVFNSRVPSTTGHAELHLAPAGSSTTCGPSTLPSFFQASSSSAYTTVADRAASVGVVVRTRTLYADHNVVSLQYYLRDTVGRPQVLMADLAVHMTLHNAGTGEMVTVPCAAPYEASGVARCTFAGGGGLKGWFTQNVTGEAYVIVAALYAGTVAAASPAEVLQLAPEVNHVALTSAGVQASLPDSPRFAGDVFTVEVKAHTGGLAVSSFSVTVHYDAVALLLLGVAGSEAFTAPTVNTATPGTVTVVAVGLAPATDRDTMVGADVLLFGISLQVTAEAPTGTLLGALSLVSNELVSVATVVIPSTVAAAGRVTDFRAGTGAVIGMMMVTEVTTVGIYAYADGSGAEMMNTAVLTGEAVASAVHTWQVYNHPEAPDNYVQAPHCRLSTPSAAAVASLMEPCTLIVDVAHFAGASRIELQVELPAMSTGESDAADDAAQGTASFNTSVIFRVWFPRRVMITTPSRVLRPIDRAAPAENCAGRLFQRAELTASASWGGNGLATTSVVDVTCLASFRTSDSSVAAVTNGSIIQGMGIGEAVVRLAMPLGSLSMSTGGLRVTVGGKAMAVVGLSVTLVTSATWSGVPTTVEIDLAAQFPAQVSLRQELRAEGDIGLVYVHALLADGGSHHLLPSNGIVVRVNPAYSTSLHIEQRADSLWAIVPVGATSATAEDMLLATWTDSCSGRVIAAGIGVGADARPAICFCKLLFSFASLACCLQRRLAAAACIPPCAL